MNDNGNEPATDFDKVNYYEFMLKIRNSCSYVAMRSMARWMAKYYPRAKSDDEAGQ